MLSHRSEGDSPGSSDSSCSDTLLVFGLVAVISDFLLFAILLWLYRKPVMYAVTHPLTFLALFLFVTFLLITLPFGLVFFVYLERVCNSEVD